MSDTARIPATEITGVTGALVKMMARRMTGEVPDSIGVLWNHRPLMRDFMRLGARSEKWRELDADLGSYATMAAAATIGCEACLDFAYFRTHNRGLDVDKAREVPRWRSSQVFSPLERQVMAYAEAMCETPTGVTDEMAAELLAVLGPAGLLELTGRVALLNATARMNTSLGIRSAEFADACGLPPLADAGDAAPVVRP